MTGMNSLSPAIRPARTGAIAVTTLNSPASCTIRAIATRLSGGRDRHCCSLRLLIILRPSINPDGVRTVAGRG
ncbi:hypothetical protein Adu01nite_78440 [Paractinoplanes durhamensis]|uniref:Uncharacterized protein n=1 Tax=Paractinoplanes durhamensis TaxID=113563 RepID=A0ABQ3ZAC2_9ACTN|nr:hypothetical protein Adu01nite_78440 [Actinoplanes durhamensis]